MRSREQTARSMAKGSGRTKQKRSNRTKRDDAERPRIRLVVDVRGDKVTAGVVVDDGRITDRVRQLNGTKAVNAMNEKAKDQREGEDRKIATDALGLSPLELAAILNCLTPEAVPMFGRASPLIVRRDKVLSVGRVRDETVGAVGLGSDRARALVKQEVKEEMALRRGEEGRSKAEVAQGFHRVRSEVGRRHELLTDCIVYGSI